MDRFHFSTVVSKGHLYKFLAMYASLDNHCESYTLYVLCANDEVYHILKQINFAHVEPVALGTIEDENLLRAKADRIFHAYCWTLKPVFLDYVMTHYPDARYFAHLDADLCFFNNPDYIFAENRDASLYLTHHRNSAMFYAYYDVTGIYNTGFVGCGNDETARKAVKRWREQCIQNCPIKEDVEKKLFGDQRYVESWPFEYENVHVVHTPGANAALWNITDYDVALKGGTVFVNDQPLLFYHFSGLTIISGNEFNICWYYHIGDQNVIEYIYRPYLILLSKAIAELGKFFPGFREGFVRREDSPDTHYFHLEVN